MGQKALPQRCGNNYLGLEAASADIRINVEYRNSTINSYDIPLYIITSNVVS